MAEALGERIQKWSKRDRRAEPLIVEFTSGFVGQLREIVLPLIYSP